MSTAITNLPLELPTISSFFILHSLDDNDDSSSSSSEGNSKFPSFAGGGINNAKKLSLEKGEMLNSKRTDLLLEISKKKGEGAH